MINRIFFLSIVLFLSLTSFTTAKESLPAEVENVGIIENIGSVLPDNLVFYDHQGNSKQIKDIFNSDKPTILNFVYYTCPMLCNLLADGLLFGITELDNTFLERFNIVTISMDHRDNKDTTALFREKYLSKLSSNNKSIKWDFYYADKSQFDQLAKLVGFNYRFIPQTQEYSHAAGIYLISPNNKITRYLYGISFQPQDLKLAVLESMEEKSVKTVDKMLLFCYNYDPDKRGYVLQAWKIMRTGGVLTVLSVILLFFYLKRSEKRE